MVAATTLVSATTLALPLPWLFFLPFPQSIAESQNPAPEPIAVAVPAEPTGTGRVGNDTEGDRSSPAPSPLSDPLALAEGLKPPAPVALHQPDGRAWDRLCAVPQTWQEEVGVQVATGLGWLEGLPRSLQGYLQNSSSEILAQVHAAPWPQLHPQATQARVPVIMYHDVLSEKQVFFDVTTAELEADFELIRDRGLTPIALDDLVLHLQTGLPLPPKPILLTFDDGYEGHYSRVLPLLERFGYPALFSVFPAKVNGDIVGRSTLTWAQLQTMASKPLVTIASHSVTHPRDLTLLPEADLLREVVDSKQILEDKLGMSIPYFTYPEGHYNEAVTAAVTAAGYRAALTMDDGGEAMAGESESLLAIDRYGQSSLETVVDLAWGGSPLPNPWQGFDFTAPVTEPQYVDLDRIPLILVSGGKPITVHADSRYQVAEIMAQTEAVAAVDGTFFSLEFLDSNTLLGPVLSQSTNQFLPGNRGENPLINDRPLVLISPHAVAFVPYSASRHTTRAALEAELPGVTDAFVGAAWLVREGEPQPAENFGTLFDFDAARDRAFWGINQAGQPVVGVSRLPVDSVTLGQVLAKAGLRDAIMLDSGASTSLAYEGQSLMDYEPRPVPHIIGLVPPKGESIAPQPCLPIGAIAPQIATQAE
ncbi:polysaccharide deacetylase family protein [Prochlorothrix hollandica]|uniref:polysaccharide deacetylase family protein n=1 Tax=Prochlorothrix hollandica TaxID=1223 RepID=UPI00333F5C0A